MLKERPAQPETQMDAWGWLAYNGGKVVMIRDAAAAAWAATKV